VPDRRILLLLALQFTGGVIVSPVGTLLPVYLSDVGYTAIFIAGAFTLQRVMGLLSSLAGGTLSDLLSRKQTIVIGLAGLLAASGAFLTRSPALILSLWALYGVGMTLNSLGSQSYLMDAAASSSLGLLTALYYWGSTLGGAIGSPAAALLLRRMSFASFGVVFLLLGALAVGLAVTALPAAPRAAAGGARAQGASRGRLFGFGDIASRPEVLHLAFLRFLPTFCYGMLTVYVPLLLQRAGSSASAIAIYATVSSLSAALAQLAAGRLADRIGPRIPSLAVYGLFAASALGIGLLPGRPEAVFVFGVLAMSGAWSLSVLLPPLVALVAPQAERGRVLGFIHLFWNLAMILGSLVGGLMFELWAGLPFLVGSAAVAAAPILVLSFFRLVSARLQCGPDRN